MLLGRHGFRLFTDYDLYAGLEAMLTRLQKDIESDSKVTTQPEEEYVLAKVKEATIKPLTLFTDRITVSQREAEIPGRYFPSGFWVEAHESYPKPVFTFHLPFDGNEQFLRMKPSTFIMWTDEVAVQNGEIEFEVINFSDDVNAIQKGRDEFLSHLQGQIGNINKDIDSYNSKLETIVRNSLKKAKEKFSTQADILSKLGNPPKID